MLLSIIGNILGDDDGGSSSSGSDGEGQLAGSISEDELLPGASSGGSGGGGAESDDDIFGGSGGDEEFLDDDSMSLDEMGDVGEMDGAGEMSLDGMDGGDDMGDMGGMNGMDAGNDQYSSEIKSRVEEMENEVGSLVSTVNTVQSENEEISESLDDIEENIRKLLEVYEMVTQGVNPFVEDDSLNDNYGAGPGTGNFDGHSLFDTDDEGEADGEEDIDEDIASAEAEAFLDESIIDEDDGFEDDFDAGDDLDGGDDLSAEDDAASDDGGSADGDLSFDDLKEEFESGDADWDEGDDVDAADDDLDAEADEDGFDDADAFDDDFGDDVEGFDDVPTDEPNAEPAFDEDGADAVELEAAAESVDETVLEPDVIAPWDDGGRPYLETVPSEYDTEFLVMDWLDYLVAEAGIDGTARTIEFYESVAWISDPVGDYLQTLLNGFNGGPDVDELEARSDLGIDHGRSLWWIEQITTPSKDQPAYAEWLTRKLPTGLDDDRAGPALESFDQTDDESTPIRLEYEEGDSTVDADDGTAVAADVDGIDSVDSEAASVDAAAVDADGPVATAAGPAQTGEHVVDEADAEDGPDDGTEPTDGSTASGSQAQKIAIEERDGSDQPDAPGVEAVQSTPTVSTGGVDTDGGQMIWVDPDIVLSESGVELRTTRDDEHSADRHDRSHHPELVTSLLGAAEDEQLERLREEYVKPLVDRTDDSSLEPWQIDLIQSLLAPDDHADRR